MNDDNKTSDAEKKDDRTQFNIYATKKTIAQGLLDIALLTTSISQLKYVLLTGRGHQFYTLLISTISISLILQVLVGVLLLLVGSMSRLKAKAEKYNNLITVFIFLITVLNVLATSFLDTISTRELYCKSIQNSSRYHSDMYINMIGG